MAEFKAIIRGAYGEGNFGDDVLMVVCYEVLREVYSADEIAFVFCSHPPEPEQRYVKKLLPGINVIQYESEASADLVVWGGGTQFYSFPDTQVITPFHRKALGGLLNPRKAINYFVKKLFGGKFSRHQKFATLGVGVGPFVPGSGEETYTRDLFAKMDFVAVRDHRSLALCRDWKVADPVLGTDLCFIPGSWWGERRSNAPAPPGTGKIGVIVRDWPHDKGGAAYGPPLLRLVASLRASGHQVSFITIRAHSEPEWMTILKAQKEPVITWNPELMTIDDFFDSLGQFDCFLTARYHGALFGALLGKPVVCIEVEQKLRLAAQMLAMPLWEQPFDEAACHSLVARVFAQYGELQALLAKAVEQQRELSATMLKDFTKFARAARSGPPSPSV